MIQVGDVSKIQVGEVYGKWSTTKGGVLKLRRKKVLAVGVDTVTYAKVDSEGNPISRDLTSKITSFKAWAEVCCESRS